mgnify:CR=1 FL=1
MDIETPGSKIVAIHTVPYQVYLGPITAFLHQLRRGTKIIHGDCRNHLLLSRIPSVQREKPILRILSNRIPTLTLVRSCAAA